jgi:hypothetical protein
VRCSVTVGIDGEEYYCREGTWGGVTAALRRDNISEDVGRGGRRLGVRIVTSNGDCNDERDGWREGRSGWEE